MFLTCNVAQEKQSDVWFLDLRCSDHMRLKAKYFPNDYWAKVVSSSTYIINRCPTKSVTNVVVECAWSGRKHSVTHMRVFVCVTYAHVQDELRKKLDIKGEKCIFFGYSDESNTYKLYNPSTKKFIVSIDV